MSRALREMGDDALRRLLEARPDLAARRPAHFGELAQHAASGRSIEPCLATLDRFCRQLLDALCLLDDGASMDQLRTLVGNEVTDRDLDDGLRRLEDLALLHRTTSGLHVPGDLRRHTPYPAGLGRPLLELLGAQPAETVKEILLTLDRRPTRAGPMGAKAPVADQVAGRLTAPGAVEALLEGAPPQARELMDTLAEYGPGCRVVWSYTDHFAPAATAAGWLQRRGLLLATHWGIAEVPREIGLALRGGRAFPRLSPRCPTVATSPVDAAKLDDCAAHAGAGLIEAVDALLQEWSVRPAVERKTGGLQVRELRRAAKVTDLADREAARLIEIVAAAGLVGRRHGDGTWAPTERFDAWSAQTPARRWLVLADAWVGMTALPSVSGERDMNDKAIAPLWGAITPGAKAQRAQVLEALTELDDDATPDVDSLVGRVAWTAPALWDQQLASPPRLVQWVLEEAELLGVTAVGSIREPGRRLLAGDGAGGEAAATRLLPPVCSEFTLQADLTAVAAGPLSPDVAGRLAELADLESKGAGAVYRVSEASIRRALDQGRTASEIHEFLAGHATRGVPQPLTYLVDDVARRHGQVRVGPATSYVVSADAALVAEVLRSRRTAKLGLRPLAPTVLVSTAEPRALLTGLRDAGFLPGAEGADGSVVVTRPAPVRAPVPPPPPALRPGRRAGAAPPDGPALDKLVAALRAAPLATPKTKAKGSRRPTPPVAFLFDDDPTDTDPYDGDPAILGVLDKGLGLARPVEIGYTSSRGVYTVRVIEPLEMDSQTVTAWCHLRNDERTFLISSIAWARMASRKSP